MEVYPIRRVRESKKRVGTSEAILGQCCQFKPERKKPPWRVSAHSIYLLTLSSPVSVPLSDVSKTEVTTIFNVSHHAYTAYGDCEA